MKNIFILTALVFLFSCGESEQETKQPEQNNQQSGDKLLPMNSTTIEGQLNTFKNTKTLTEEMNAKTKDINEYLESEK